jgi:hypothetical protein
VNDRAENSPSPRCSASSAPRQSSLSGTTRPWVAPSYGAFASRCNRCPADDRHPAIRPAAARAAGDAVTGVPTAAALMPLR